MDGLQDCLIKLEALKLVAALWPLRTAADRPGTLAHCKLEALCTVEARLRSSAACTHTVTEC